MNGERWVLPAPWKTKHEHVIQFSNFHYRNRTNRFSSFLSSIALLVVGWLTNLSFIFVFFVDVGFLHFTIHSLLF